MDHPRRAIIFRKDGLVTVSLWLSGVLYAVSFLLPAATFVFDQEEVLFGWQAFVFLPLLLVGALGELVYGNVVLQETKGIFILGLPFIWLANPLLWLSMYGLYKRRQRLAFITGILAWFAGSCFMMIHLWRPGSGIHPLVGGFCWLASIAVVAATVVYRKLVPYKPQPWTEILSQLIQ